MSNVGIGNIGTVLQGAGSGVTPTFSTATYPSVATGTGKILRADGTNWVPTTATFPDLAGTSGNVLTSDGTNWISSPNTAGGGILVVSGQLTNTQIKNLHGTPVQIIAAPGSGKVIQLLSTSAATLNYGGTNAFTNGGASSLSVAYGATTAGGILTSTAITATSSQIQFFAFGGGAVTYTTYANIAVSLFNSSATEWAGNAANDNTISYNIIYRIITIP